MADYLQQHNVVNEAAPAIGAIPINYGGGDQVIVGYSRALYIQTGGNLTVSMQRGDPDVTFTGLLAGTIYPICCTIIRQAGGTAAGLVLF